MIIRANALQSTTLLIARPMSGWKYKLCNLWHNIFNVFIYDAVFGRDRTFQQRVDALYIYYATVAGCLLGANLNLHRLVVVIRMEPVIISIFYSVIVQPYYIPPGLK